MVSGYLPFWWRCVRWAAGQWQKGESWLNLILVAKVLTIIPITAIALLIAPYALWRTQKNKADELQERLVPKLEVRPEERSRGPASAWAWTLRVQNAGDLDMVDRCYAQVVELRHEDIASVNWAEGQDIRLLWYQGDSDDAAVCSFQKEAVVDVIRAPTEGNNFYIAAPHPSAQTIPITGQSVLLDIRVGAQNCSPQLHRYRVTISGSTLYPHVECEEMPAV